MSAPQPPEAAVEAAKEALRGYTGDCICDEAYTSRRLVDPSCSYHDMEGAHNDILTAALPHLHRAWLEALIAKYEAQARQYGDGLNFPSAGDWLRAELAEGGDGE